MLNTRGCGILLHPTSLPGPGGIGTLGPDARRFIDLLHKAGMAYWQVLPLNPPACGNSPYSSFTAFGGNPLLIDLEQLAEEDDLPSGPTLSGCPDHRVAFGRAMSDKMEMLYLAAVTFLSRPGSNRMDGFLCFCESTPWLHDYALFMALKRRYSGAVWNQWPDGYSCPPLKLRDTLSSELAHEVAIQKYLQWRFFSQWHALRHYANQRGISIIGDIPIFVAYDSADVWSQRELFLLDAAGNPTFVAGVPPDYFSATGQLWGNPLYDWNVMEQRGYQWWIERFKATFDFFDIARVDHFRGFAAAWHVPAEAKTAVCGNWVTGPGSKLFDAVCSSLGQLPIIAEDLGVITPDVLALRDRYNFPGMKILQFAFDAELDERDLPHNHVRRGVVYTGTHDNDTTKGWYTTRLEAERIEMNTYLGSAGVDCVADLIRAALMSVADTAVIPLQDILKLGSEARMNIPGTPYGNWEWRFSWDMIPGDLAVSLRRQLQRYGRLKGGSVSYAT